MILQALVHYYEALEKSGQIAPPGWSPVKVSYGLELDQNGNIINVISLKVPDKNGTKAVPQMLTLPTPFKRSSGIKANFLCDNSAYILGVDAKGKPERSLECFRAAKEFHHRLLDGCKDPAVTALLRFFDDWDVGKLDLIFPDAERKKDILNGANLVFLCDGHYLHENAQVRRIWQEQSAATEGEKSVCLVTGKTAVTAVLHPSIKGIMGAQSSGASLVSFNAPAFCSYRREQGFNAPTSEYAAFAYGAALNHLISMQHNRIGDTAVLFWTENAEPQYQSLMNFCIWNEVPQNYTAEDLHSIVKSVCAGKTVDYDQTRIDPKMQFYLLGLAPNAARLSVRFFFRNSFGAFLQNIQEHQQRLEIIHSEKDPFAFIPLWKLLSETVNQNSKNKTPVPNMAGETLRAILNNTPYPATLLNGVTLRIRADHTLNRTRAAIIKAYYLKKENSNVPKEVLQVSLNPECRDIAYVLGRLFALLENIQNTANPNINSTIRDKYFNSASATPAVIFPTLINLAQKHLKKIGGGLRIKLDQQLTELLGLIEEQSYPAHLSLPQQGAFQLGYYHQTEARYTKKEEK